MRRLFLILVLVIAVLLTVNTIVTDNETKSAKADIGRILELPEGDLQVRAVRRLAAPDRVGQF